MIVEIEKNKNKGALVDIGGMEMNMPGFTAERSLYKSRFAYRTTGVYVQASSGTVSPAYIDMRDRYLFPLEPEPGVDEMQRCYCYTAYCDCKRACETAFGLCMQAVIVSYILGTPIGSIDGCKEIRKYCKEACAEIFGKDIRVECYPPETPPTPPSLAECERECQGLTGARRYRCMEACGVL